MFRATDVTVIMGQRECGKSTLTREIAAVYPRQIIFDSLGEYGDTPDTVYSFEEFSQRLVATAHASRVRIVYRFSPERATQLAEFDEACRAIYYRGNVVIIVEEVQNFVSPNSIPYWFSQCLTTGRHEGLAVIANSQMPRFIHKGIISQARHIFCGLLHEKNDVLYAADYFYDHIDEMKHLPRGHFLYFTPGSKITTIQTTPK